MYCSNCGEQMTEGNRFCSHCGAAVQATSAAPVPQRVVVNVVNQNTNTNQFESQFGPQKSRWTAFFLCLFFGYLGIHKFYVGKKGMGILYLFTLGLLGIGWLIDTLVLLFGGSRDKWGRKLA